MWVAFAFAKATLIFSAKIICELDIVLTRTVNILTTNGLVKLTMLWTTGPRVSTDRSKASVTFILCTCICSFICVILFVIICCSSFLLLAPWENCTSWLWHFLYTFSSVLWFQWRRWFYFNLWTWRPSWMLVPSSFIIILACNSFTGINNRLLQTA